MQDISLADLLKAGAHFGHQQSRWHPKMKPFIYTSRNGIYIIDLAKTKAQLEAAAAFVASIAERNGTVLFVGTKRQVKSIIERESKRAGLPYVVNRWIGGTFTNWPTVSKLIAKYKRLKDERDRGEFQKYTKKERLKLEETIERTGQLVGGIENMSKLPDAIFIVDLKIERTALREAMKTNVPVIAIVDTNVDPTPIAYPIPANDDATKTLEIIITCLASEFLTGQSRAQVPVEQTESVAEPAIKDQANETKQP